MKNHPKESSEQIFSICHEVLVPPPTYSVSLDSETVEVERCMACHRCSTHSFLRAAVCAACTHMNTHWYRRRFAREHTSRENSQSTEMTHQHFPLSVCHGNLKHKTFADSSVDLSHRLHLDQQMDTYKLCKSGVTTRSKATVEANRVGVKSSILLQYFQQITQVKPQIILNFKINYQICKNPFMCTLLK